MDPDQPSPHTGFSEDLKTYSVPVIDVTQSVWDFFFKRHPFIFFFLIILPILITCGIAYLEYVSFGASLLQNRSSAEGAVIITFLPLLVTIITFASVRLKMEKVFFTELANALGCTYQESLPPPTTGQLAHLGLGRSFSNILSGTYIQLPFQLGNYTYETGDSKHRQYHPYTIGIVTITAAALPHIICIPKSWESVLFNKWKPSDIEELHLEGNFNSSFTVYVPTGTEIEALQILEPNVMEKLMDGFEDFAFESIDSTLYLFTTGSMQENREAVLRLYSLLQRFCNTLAPELHSFAAPSQPVN